MKVHIVACTIWYKIVIRAKTRAYSQCKRPNRTVRFKSSTQIHRRNVYSLKVNTQIPWPPIFVTLNRVWAPDRKAQVFSKMVSILWRYSFPVSKKSVTKLSYHISSELHLCCQGYLCQAAIYSFLKAVYSVSSEPRIRCPKVTVVRQYFIICQKLPVLIQIFKCDEKITTGTGSLW